MLDTSQAVETPEGVDLNLRCAGPVVRAQAWLIDQLIRLGFYIATSMVLSLLGNMGTGLWLVMMFLMEWFYPVLFEMFNHGATPGKKTLGLRVIQDNGTPVGWSSSLLRNLLRTVDFMPFLYGFGLCSMLLTKDFRRLGDIAAATLVIYQERPSPPQHIPQQESLTPPLPLILTEQRAILDFCERSTKLSEERQAELANILGQMTGEQDQRAVTQLQRYANWLQGGK